MIDVLKWSISVLFFYCQMFRPRRCRFFPTEIFSLVSFEGIKKVFWFVHVWQELFKTLLARQDVKNWYFSGLSLNSCFYFVFLMAVIYCLFFVLFFLRKKNAGIKECATAVGHPAENFQFKFVFCFFIYITLSMPPSSVQSWAFH